MYAAEILEYMNIVSGYVTDGKFYTRMIFNDKEAIVQAVKNYNISRLVDYKVHESELLTFYCKCKNFVSECQ